MEWAATHGGGFQNDTLRIPQMEPGEYKLCKLAPTELVSITTRVPEERCDEGILFPSEELTLQYH
jgi:hypothetical protein